MLDLLLTHATVATMADGAPFGLVPDGAVGIEGGKIAWIGPAAQAPPAAAVRDLAGKVVTPGLVDPHTHIVYGEEGLVDFEILSQGGQRWDLEPKGGGVGQLVQRTRRLSEEAIYAASHARMSRLIANGVTTVESKSGAGLDRDTELRLMRISRALGRDLPVTVVSTFLGAHGLAPEYAGRRDDYVDFLADDVLPEAVREGLVDQVDGFCDEVGFSHAQMDRLFARAASFGLGVKLHADQYTDFGAGAVVARHRGLSADHLEFASEATVRAMAEAGTVATLLAGAHYSLHETWKPPVDLFRALGVPMALATNSNPVSSPTVSPASQMNLACFLFRLTPEEALRGFTVNGARALGLGASAGLIATGRAADLAVWDTDDPRGIAYPIGGAPCLAVLKDGAVVHEAPAPRLARA
ncbi:imidazolonepropionase [Reyranella sp.]|uniref:imidazolonepropionase n=1 Tax=Reyranella sp. TaxID=1929291 RepID=UPI003BAD7338